MQGLSGSSHTSALAAGAAQPGNGAMHAANMRQAQNLAHAPRALCNPIHMNVTHNERGNVTHNERGAPSTHAPRRNSGLLSPATRRLPPAQFNIGPSSDTALQGMAKTATTLGATMLIFGGVAAIFSSVEALSESVRGEADWKNGALGGLAAGTTPCSISLCAGCACVGTRGGSRSVPCGRAPAWLLSDVRLPRFELCHAHRCANQARHGGACTRFRVRVCYQTQQISRMRLLCYLPGPACRLGVWRA